VERDHNIHVLARTEPRIKYGALGAGEVLGDRAVDRMCAAWLEPESHVMVTRMSRCASVNAVIARYTASRTSMASMSLPYDGARAAGPQ